jgi:hypothetical protein
MKSDARTTNLTVFSGKGWHGPRGKKAALHLNDLSSVDATKDATKLKGMLPFLQRTGKVTAVSTSEKNTKSGLFSSIYCSYKHI